MKNYVQPGEVITLTAPYDVLSGAGLQVGQFFGVATFDATSGVVVEAILEGVVDIAKVTAQAWTVGALIYWDNAAKLATTGATGNLLIGAATKVTTTSATTGFVRLNGAPRANNT